MVVIYTLAETPRRKLQVCILLPPNGRTRLCLELVLTIPKPVGREFWLSRGESTFGIVNTNPKRVSRVEIGEYNKKTSKGGLV